MQVDRKLIDAALAVVAATSEGIDVRLRIIDSYSGRGMHGHECFALGASERNSVSELLLEVAAMRRSDALDTARTLTRSMCTDTLGLGIVAYFPGHTITPKETTEEVPA